MLFSLMKSQQGNLEMFLVDQFCRGGPNAFAKGVEGGGSLVSHALLNQKD